MTYYMGLDLGQAADYSACVVLDQQQQGRQPPTYTCVLAHRWDLGTSYPTVIGTLVTHLARPEMRGHALCVDYTGCGRPVVDELRRCGLTCMAVSIHGGVTESHNGRNWSVPKRKLVGTVQVLLQSGRLRFAAGMPLLPVVQHELMNFRVTIDPHTSHDLYSSWRERDHDDLVLSLALAAWCAERFAGMPLPTIDLTRALHGLTRVNRTPGQRLRLGDGVTDEGPTALDWDEAKQAASEGRVPLDYPLRPERP